MKKKTLAILIASVAALNIAACGGNKQAETKQAETTVASAAAETTSDADTKAELEVYEAIVGKIFIDESSNEWKFNADDTFIGTANGDVLDGTYDVKADEKGAHLTITLDGTAIDEGIIAVEGDKIVITPSEGEKQVLTAIDVDAIAIAETAEAAIAGDDNTVEEIAAYGALFGKKFVDQNGNEWNFNDDNSFSGVVAGETLTGTYDIVGDENGAQLTISIDGTDMAEGTVTVDGDNIVITDTDGSEQILTEAE